MPQQNCGMEFSGKCQISEIIAAPTETIPGKRKNFFFEEKLPDPPLAGDQSLEKKITSVSRAGDVLLWDVLH